MYNIIGDIHSRDVWKKLVREDCVNVFVGDYFSPYEYHTFNEQEECFMDIVLYKMKHPETIMLIGNHDEDHWHIREMYSRFDMRHYEDISRLFEENKDYLQIAYSIENKILVTHAGVSKLWYENNIKNTITPDNICNSINELWINGNFSSFNFKSNKSILTDYYGNDPNQGPLWIRPKALITNNVFTNTNYYQVVGHTKTKHIFSYNNIYFIDTLSEKNPESLLLDIKDDNIQFSINKI